MCLDNALKAGSIDPVGKALIPNERTRALISPTPLGTAKLMRGGFDSPHPPPPRPADAPPRPAFNLGLDDSAAKSMTKTVV